MGDRWLVVMALPLEGQGVFEHAGVEVLYTGVGKVNAAHVLTRALHAGRPVGQPLPSVLNFGSAGSRRFATGSLVSCTRFLQRDMDAAPLGFAPGVTPYDEMPAVIEFASSFPTLQSASCGTGDSFATTDAAMQADVVDMEAYALAKVCRAEGTGFACAKYVSDGADHAAANDWRANLHRAAEQFLALYRSLS